MRVKIPVEYKETSQSMKKKPYKAVVILPDGQEIVLAEFDSYPAARAFINRTTLGTR